MELSRIDSSRISVNFLQVEMSTKVEKERPNRQQFEFNVVKFDGRL
jgi:hypothetical protein